jgi:hypothetical protein
MSFLEAMKKAAMSSPTNITVKVQCKKTQTVKQSFDCGTDQAKADTKENELLQSENLDAFHVYQSITV